MDDGREWTLRSWIEHTERVRELERELRAAEHELMMERINHLREFAKILEETNQVHFDQLNENAKRTIEERGHFVSVESYLPFKDQVQEFMHSYSGRREGSSTVVHWIMAGLGTLVGLLGALAAIITRL